MSLRYLCFGLLLSALASAAAAQDQTKSIQSGDYLNKRPMPTEGSSVFSFPKKGGPTAQGAAAVRVRVRKRPRPVIAKRPPVPVRSTETARLGFTVWRLRESTEADKTKGFTEVDERTGKRLTAERLDSGQTYSNGDIIRIGVEPLSHSGYLYVIEREKYADGSYGAPNLVYPTLRYRDGNNLVSPGVLTFVPPPPVGFEIEANTARKQSAEEVIMILSPKKLIDPARLQMGQIEISTAQVLEWIKNWASDEVQIDQVDDVGVAMTESEHSAGADQTKGFKERMLTRDDPWPQTTVEMKIRRGDPIITTVTLPLKGN